MPDSDNDHASTSGTGRRTAMTSQSIIFANDLQGIKPPTFNWESSDLSHHFNTFKRYCELILSTPTYANKQGKELVKYILLWMGPQAVEIFDNWSHLSDAQKESPDDVWLAFKNYFEPKSNFRLARFQLRDLMQQGNEPIDNYIVRLKVQAQKCNFATPSVLEDNLIDQLIKGTCHATVRKKLLECDPKSLTLDKAVDFSRTFEATQLQLLQFGQAQRDVNSVNYVRKGNQKKPRFTNSKAKESQSCYKCGLTYHTQEVCPARDQHCNNCGIVGHWGKVCRNSKQSSKQNAHRPNTWQSKSSKSYSVKKKKNINEVQNRPSDNSQLDLPVDFESLSFDTLIVNCDSVGNSEKEEVFASIRIKPYDIIGSDVSTNMRGKVDTGAQGNVLPLRTFKKLYPKYVNSKGLPTNTKYSATTLIAYNGTVIPHHGTISIPCKNLECEDWLSIVFYVAETPGPVLFGCRACRDLGIVKINCAIDAEKQEMFSTKCVNSLHDLQMIYPDRFTGLGKFPTEHRLQLKENAQPVTQPPRRAPIQLRDKIKAELDRMISLDVIRPVQEHTDWVSSIAYVKKPDGSLRLCLDPKPLNDALKRSQHHIPTLEELTHRFCGATVFSKLDAKSGYWSVQLDPKSQLYTTFNSPFGRFCYKRLPFGLKTSQDVFQEAMDHILEGLSGVISIADDITVFGRDEKEHDKNLHKLMQRAREHGLVFNPNKCHIKGDSIKFFGNIYNKNGVHPDPEKVQAIANLAVPNDVSELQSFLGMVTYLAPYIPQLSSHTTPLRQLLCKDIEFQWYPEHQQAFEKIKSLICTAGTLSYFNPSQPVVIQVDASQAALGAALTQNGKPIAYASKSLSDTEKRYANIERELLACVFGAERFHTYVFGKEFIIESDHRPLEMISRKNLTAAPARLQRMFLRLQRYDYKISYKPGKEMILPDSLSRIPCQGNAKDQEIDLSLNVCMVQFSTSRLEELREATKQDEELFRLLKCIVQGFPENQKDIHQCIRKYWSFRDELSVEDGIILKGEQVIIPPLLRKEYLHRVHEGHQGMTRCQQRAKSCIYWPGINKDIEELVTNCSPCQKFQPSQQKENLQPILQNIPSIPWYTVSTDLFTQDGKNYLIVADCFSKYPIVEELGQDCSSKMVARLTSKMFSLFGVPHTIISDNGPQYQGSAYRTMVEAYGINHITSSPWHPKSHGFIERMIRSVENLLRKSPEDTDKALLNFRTTPPGPQMPSPAELLFGRKVQSNLPVHTRGPSNDYFREKRQNQQSETSSRYDQDAKELPDLDMNQTIYYQDAARKTWFPGTIIGYGPEPRSYTIKCCTTGKHLRRNRILLRPRKVTDEDYRQQCPKSDTLVPEFPSRVENAPSIHNQKTPLAFSSPSETLDISVENNDNDNPSPIIQSNQTPAKVTRSGRLIRPAQRLIEKM